MHKSNPIIQIITKALKDREFKEKLIQSPKEAIKEEINIQVPDHIKIKVLEESENQKYLILPYLPEDELEEKDLLEISGGGSGGCCNLMTKHPTVENLSVDCTTSKKKCG